MSIFPRSAGLPDVGSFTRGRSCASCALLIMRRSASSMTELRLRCWRAASALASARISSSMRNVVRCMPLSLTDDIKLSPSSRVKSRVVVRHKDVKIMATQCQTPTGAVPLKRRPAPVGGWADLPPGHAVGARLGGDGGGDGGGDPLIKLARND